MKPLAHPCIVNGCNKPIQADICYFSLPRNEDRAKAWLKAVGRENSCTKLRNIKVCSNHFLPTSIRNNRLTDDAIPRINLPEPVLSADHGVVCSICNLSISGYRYKCVECNCYDLCEKCEKSEEHDKHYMMRIPKPITDSEAEALVTKYKSDISTSLQRSESPQNLHQNSTVKTVYDSDDEPITKYQGSNCNIELSIDVKRKVINEVNRVFNLIRKKRKSTDKSDQRKKMKADKPLSTQSLDCSQKSQAGIELEVEFADVNNFKSEKPAEDIMLADESQQVEIKTEVDAMLFNLLSS